MQVPIYNMEGEVTGQIDLDDYIFGIEPNEAVVHQALVRQLTNRRAGTASTKTRGEVVGSTRKLFRQKHTGFARAGSRRSPLRHGGGIVFGPRPRKYFHRLPKKMKRLAIRSVLSSKVADSNLFIIEQIDIAQPNTKQMANVFKALNVELPALLVTADPDINIAKSARNISRVKTIPAYMINVADLLSHKTLLMTKEATKRVESIWGQKQVSSEA